MSNDPNYRVSLEPSDDDPGVVLLMMVVAGQLNAVRLHDTYWDQFVAVVNRTDAGVKDYRRKQQAKDP